MAKCIKCGRKGLFLQVNKNGLCAECVAANDAHYEELRRQHEGDQRKYAEYCAINQKYQEANALEPVDRIAAYERLMKEYPNYIAINSMRRQLATFCRMEKQYGKAWQLLNQAYFEAMRNPEVGAPSPSIRYEQFLVLSEEGRRPLEAVQLLGCFYILRGECPPSFYKKIRPLTNKAGLSKEQTEAIVDLVHRFNSEGIKEERAFTIAYRELITVAKKEVAM